MLIQKLSSQNNGWTKKEAKIFRRNSVISRILHWLDWNWQLWSKDIYYLRTYCPKIYTVPLLDKVHPLVTMAQFQLLYFKAI